MYGYPTELKQDIQLIVGALSLLVMERIQDINKERADDEKIEISGNRDRSIENVALRLLNRHVALSHEVGDDVTLVARVADETAKDGILLNAIGALVRCEFDRLTNDEKVCDEEREAKIRSLQGHSEDLLKWANDVERKATLADTLGRAMAEKEEVGEQS